MTNCTGKNQKHKKQLVPWDQSIARALVTPFLGTKLHPNHLTSFRALVGLLACAFFALGGSPWIHLGAGLFIFSNFLDHTDGEFARISGKTSKFGHQYDVFCDTIIHILAFISIGVGLINSHLGFFALIMGGISGVFVGGLFFIFQLLEARTQIKQAGLPRVGRFDFEDVLYVVGPIIWLGGIMPLLYAAAIGAPLFSLWSLWRYRSFIFRRKSNNINVK